MNKYWEILKTNKLIRIGSLNSFSILVKIISGVITSKVVALFLGTEGMAMIGNLRNFLTSIYSISTLGIYNGIVKYFAEYKKDKKELSKMLSTSSFIIFLAVLISSGCLYITPSFWSTLVFGQEKSYEFVFKAIAISLPFCTINTFCLAVINGASKYKLYIIINIVSGVLGVLTTVFLIYKYNLKGGFAALIVIPCFSLLITFVLIGKQTNFVRLIGANYNYKIGFD